MEVGMKMRILVVGFLSTLILFISTELVFAKRSNSENVFEEFKSQISFWYTENAKFLSSNIDDNIVFNPLDLECEFSGSNNWSCKIRPVLRKGDHAYYEISVIDASKERINLVFSVYSLTEQIYDKYGNYLECKLDWKVETKSDDIIAGWIYMVISNFNTGRPLQYIRSELPLLKFDSATYPGKCEN